MIGASCNVQVEWMVRRDMPAVVAIEQASFPIPWSDDDFIVGLRQRNCIGMVARLQGQVVGFMIYELHQARLHLENFAVAPAYRRRGIGAKMVDSMKTKLSPQRRKRITLAIHERNLAGQLFFGSQGFRCASVMREFYDDTDDDAYLFQYRIGRAQ